MSAFSDLFTWIVEHRALASLAIIVFVFFGRWLVYRLVRHKRTVMTPQQRRSIARARDIASLALLFAMITLWHQEISAFAISIAAFIAALLALSTY